jgi:hypothetical protein
MNETLNLNFFVVRRMESRASGMLRQVLYHQATPLNQKRKHTHTHKDSTGI